MREVKFRAWEVKQKRMYPVLGVYCGADLADFGYPSNSFLSYPNYFGVVAYLPLKEEDRVIMQYTGVRDKNGMEIYEGDIVRCVYPEEDMDSTEAQVRYNNVTKAAFVLYADGAEWDLWQDEDTSELEVIGNIYENPEMVKNG